MLFVFKFIIDILLTVLILIYAKNIREISDFIPDIQLPIYNIPNKEYYHFIIASIFFIIWRGFRYGLYDTKPFISIYTELKLVFKTIFMWLILTIAYLYFTQGFLYTIPIPRLIIIYSFLLLIILLSLYRILLWFLIKYFKLIWYKKINVLFIGANSISNKIANDLRNNIAYNIIGAVDEKIRSTKKNELKIIGTIDNIENIIDKYNITEIIFTMSDIYNSNVENVIDICQIKHISFKFVPDILSIYDKNIEVLEISGIPIITLKNTPLSGWMYIIKSLIDRVLSFIFIILLLPLFIIIAIAIKLDSKGPILFSKHDDGRPLLRVGKNKKPFHYFKFRSMYDKVHSQEKFLKNERSDGPMFKIKNDPRVTRVGKILRKTHLDELPELFLVLFGHMSLVGPRPHWIEEVEKYKKYYNKVFEIKPGITGLAQIKAYNERSGTQDMTFEEEVKLDIHYMQNWSLGLDFYILIKTIFLVIKKIFT